MVDLYGNILSYVKHEQSLPENWSELSISLSSLHVNARSYVSCFLIKNNSAKYKKFKLEKYIVEDFYLLISSYNEETAIVKVKAVWSNEVEKHKEETFCYQVSFR